MQTYFDAEMRKLRVYAREFARRFPEQAPMLGGGIDHHFDPHIERLLEGVAYLTGNIQQRLDHELPELCGSLLEQMAPQLVRPFPAVAMIAVRPTPGALTKTMQIQAGTEFVTEAVGDEQAVCKFQVAEDVNINPLSIVAITGHDLADGHFEITLSCELDIAATINKLDLANLALYIQADLGLAQELLFACTQELVAVEVVYPELGGVGPQRGLTMSPKIGPALLFHQAEDYATTASLQDYFNARERLFYLELQGLEQISWPENCTRFDIKVITQSQFSDQQLSKDCIQLNVVPAINIFQVDAEPIQIKTGQFEYPVIIDRQRRESQQVYVVDQLIGQDKKGAVQQHALWHQFGLGTTHGLQTVTRDYAGRRDIYLLVHQQLELAEQQLTVSVRATNGDYPHRFLSAGMSLMAQALPAQFNCQLLRQPTSSVMPPAHADLPWQLLGHLALQIQSISQPEQLKKILQTVAWRHVRQAKNRINSIEQLTVSAKQTFHHGLLRTGFSIQLTLNETCFSSQADVYLFGLVLQQFFAQHAAVNYFVELTVHCLPSNREFVWKPQFGVNCPL